MPDIRTDETSYGLHDITELSRAENIKVGNYETTYFEIDLPEDYDEYKDRFVMGYSLLFEENPVSFQEYLQYLILTLASYQGEGFCELQGDNNFSSYYNNYIAPSVDRIPVEGAKGFTLYGFKRGIANEPSASTVIKSSQTSAEISLCDTLALFQ